MLRGVTIFGLLFGAALFLRLALLPLIHNPGISDQNHYYNLGLRLLQGHGLTIDYVWHFHRLSDSIAHPIDHWMPLAGVASAAGMVLFGEGPRAALTVFILAGSLVPILVYIGARQLRLPRYDALLAGAFAVALPDVVWHSLRSDTAVLNMVLISGAVLAFIHAYSRDCRAYFVLSGACAGLAYLNRNDALIFLPMLLMTLTTWHILPGGTTTWRRSGIAFALTVGSFALLIAPWLVRNALVLGMLGSPETSKMFFMVDWRDHYAFNRPLTLASMLERQTIQQLIFKRAFELLAAVKQIIVSLDIVLPVLVPLGAGIALWERRWYFLRWVTPVAWWLIGILVAYPLLVPIKSQSGSFEKAYLSILPLLIPVGMAALHRLVPNGNWRGWFVFLTVCLMALRSYDVLRSETALANAHYADAARVAALLATLPDRTGDGEVRLMVQDPFVMRYVGVRSIMTPSSSRDDALALAAQYHIDYAQFPAARPELDAVAAGNVPDNRFELVASLPRPGRSDLQIYALHPEEAP